MDEQKHNPDPEQADPQPWPPAVPPPVQPMYPPPVLPQYPPQYAPQPGTSGLAIASLVLGILWIYGIGSVLAVIFGAVALNKISDDPRIGGKGMAIAGLVLGIIGSVLLVIILIAAGSGSY